MTAGIHGLERIGTQVVLAFAVVFANPHRLGSADTASGDGDEYRARSLVNPGGMFYNIRANPQWRRFNAMRRLRQNSKRPCFTAGNDYRSGCPGIAARRVTSWRPNAKRWRISFNASPVSGRRSRFHSDCHSGFGFRIVLVSSALTGNDLSL